MIRSYRNFFRFKVVIMHNDYVKKNYTKDW